MITKDIQVKNFKPTNKVQKPTVGKGLYLQVMPNGSKYWRMNYRFAHKQKTLAIGVYPDVSLKMAKEKRDEARKLLANGVDPSIERKTQKLTKSISDANSLELIAREWHTQNLLRWSETHANKLIRLLERDIFPWLGSRPITEIEPIEILATVRRIEERGAIDTAHRALQTCGQIFKYAISTTRAKYNVCADLNGALKPVRKKHYAAITESSELAPLLNDIKQYKGSLITRTALQILPYIFIRSGELRHAEWQEIDFDKALWTIPSHRMKVKTGVDHIIPLSKQVLSLFKELKPLTHHASKYVFHGDRSVRKPMSENAVLAALRGLGYSKDQVTPHGFRATARTLLDEALGYPPHIIEHQLAHAVKDSNGRAYNRTTHLEQRIEMMQEWADYLDRLAEEG